MNTKTCCPKFDPIPWDGKTFEWKEKRFIKTKVFTLFYMPIGFGSAVKRLMAQTEHAGANVPDSMGLSDHTSKWNMDFYLAVDKAVEGAANTTLSGAFFSKVYEGPFRDTGKWCRDFASLAKQRSLTITKMYMWYTTCPKCAKEYGQNYVVLVGKTN